MDTYRTPRASAAVVVAAVTTTATLLAVGSVGSARSGWVGRVGSEPSVGVKMLEGDVWGMGRGHDAKVEVMGGLQWVL